MYVSVNLTDWLTDSVCLEMCNGYLQHSPNLQQFSCQIHRNDELRLCTMHKIFWYIFFVTEWNRNAILFSNEMKLHIRIRYSYHVWYNIDRKQNVKCNAFDFKYYVLQFTVIAIVTEKLYLKLNIQIGVPSVSGFAFLRFWSYEHTHNDCVWMITADSLSISFLFIQKHPYVE